MVLESITLISISFWLLEKIAEKGFNALIENTIKSEDINNKFYKAVEKTCNTLQEKYPDLLGGSIDYFFKKENVFNELIKLLFVDSKINIEIITQQFDTTTLPKEFIFEFITLLKEEVNKDRSLNKILSDNELFLAIIGIGKDLSSVSKFTNLSSKELEKIRKILEERFIERFSLEDFKKLYRKNAYHILSQVNFIGLGVDLTIKKGKSKRLQDIFVKPRFSPLNPQQASLFDYSNEKPENRNNESLQHYYKKEIEYSNIFSSAKNLVVLGNPGTGKSIFIKSVICEILKENRSENEFLNENIYSFVPFRIELRKYLAFKKENGASILHYLLFLLSSEYGIINLLYENILQLFTEEKVIIFFDGLDEIFNLESKIEVKNDIEVFQNSHPKVLSVTTSRIIGYEDAKFTHELFVEIQILNFNDQQIEDYVSKWYAKEEEDLKIREKEITEFLILKNKVDPELITNPLLLSLIVILYRNNLRIPESKLEIYQSCSKTLVDKWDSAKELKIDMQEEVYKRKEAIFADLAYWQYKQLSSKDIKITYKMVIRTVSDTILKKLKIGDEYTADIYAEQFLAYAQKRSLYFENNFTHKTFLEYFAAFWIYTNIEKKHKEQERNDIIFKYNTNPFWFIVLELLFNFIDKDQPDNEIIDNLIIKQIDENSNTIPFVLAILPSLINISSVIIDKILSESILVLVKKSEIINKSQKKNTEPILLRLQELIQIPKFREKVIILINLLLNLLQDKNYETNLLILLYELFDRRSELISEYLNEGNRKKLLDYKNKNEYLYICECYNKGNDEYLDEMLKFIELYEPNAVFHSNVAKYEKYTLIDIFTHFVIVQFNKSNIKSISENYYALKAKKLTLQIIIKNIKPIVCFVDYKGVFDYLNISDDIEVNIFIFICLAAFYQFPDDENFRVEHENDKYFSLMKKLFDKDLPFENKKKTILDYFNYELESEH